VAVGAAITSGVVGVAASPAAENRFKLSPELEARVTAHREMVANAGRSIADFCRLASDTVELLDPIRLELSHFEGDQRSSPPFAAVERAYTRTTKRVPGLYLYAFEEGYRTGIDYPTLARLAPDDARALLRAMDHFETVPAGGASWVTMMTDYSGCHDPENARRPLTALAKAWPAAPSCLRDAFREHLNRLLQEMASDSHFCGARRPILAAVRRNARLLQSLADTRGPELAGKLLKAARAPEAQFLGDPG